MRKMISSNVFFKDLKKKILNIILHNFCYVIKEVYKLDDNLT